jgi:hypothetical protein
MSGTHVTGFVSCTRIFQMFVSSAAPFMPSIWRAPALPSVASLSSAAARSFCAASWRTAGPPAGAAMAVTRREEQRSGQRAWVSADGAASARA